MLQSAAARANLKKTAFKYRLVHFFLPTRPFRAYSSLSARSAAHIADTTSSYTGTKSVFLLTGETLVLKKFSLPCPKSAVNISTLKLNTKKYITQRHPL